MRYDYYCWHCGHKTRSTGRCGECGCPARERTPKGWNPCVAGGPLAQEQARLEHMNGYLDCLAEGVTSQAV